LLNILNNELRDQIIVQKEYKKKCLINGNSGHLHQVFINIIVNAIQSIEGNGTLRITTKVQDNKVAVTVSDSGKGISKDLRGRIFEPFFTTKESGKGTGLGLSISRKIVLQHNGMIELDSELGSGTTFKVVLPAAENG